MTAPAAQKAAADLRATPLRRGGIIIVTSRGPVQLGVPPETIKDTLPLSHGVPDIFVLAQSFFSYERGVCFAELEFPTYYNYFLRQRKTHVVGTPAQLERVRRFLGEALFGPAHIDLTAEVEGVANWGVLPDLPREMAYFRRCPSAPERAMELSDLLALHALEEPPLGGPRQAVIDSLRFELQADGALLLEDLGQGGATIAVSRELSLPARSAGSRSPSAPFTPPRFAVTVLGAGHGFDVHGKTTGLLLWIDGRGILVDPPVDTTEVLRDQEVPLRCIDSVILTHCHGDHDAGTLQKALQADRVRLLTTHTIYNSFVRKSALLTQLPRERFDAIVEHVPVPVYRPVQINGARFRFTYTLHSIPTIGFSVELDDKRLLYTADTLNDPGAIRALADAGVLSPGRAADLLSFDWSHDLVIHEAGVPPLHTPVDVLARLSAETKQRLLVVHTSRAHIPPESGLRVAAVGLRNTVVLSAGNPASGGTARRLMALAAVDHFRALPVAKALEFLDVVHEVSFSAGEVIVRHGEEAGHFYMILSGKAVVTGGEVPEKVLVAYDYFGESALLLGGPRTANVTAVSAVRALALTREDFLRLIAGTPVRERMLKLSANRQRQTWQLLDDHPVLATLGAYQRNELQSMMEELSGDAGRELVEAGQAPAALRIVAAGEVEAICPHGKSGRMGRGQLVGSLPEVVRGSLEPYSVHAVTTSRVFALPAAELRRFFLTYPGVYLRLLHEDRGRVRFCPYCVDAAEAQV
ncbi:MAG: cyclic nucleotide-binding domain-containing protein [Candidatus Schekmanbacteria bacterium]|nr:cyclic nucleotide-binding domain-containing protein [Candidatus Schekmanbacteria bacterium]